MPEFKLPDPGEGLVEATIVQWKVAVGDTVATNDIVVEVETAKSLVELPIPWAGTVTEILAQEGEEVEVGAPIIVIDTGDGGRPAGGSGTTSVEDVTDAATAASDDLVPTAPAGGESAQEGAKREAVLVGYGAIEGSTTRRRRRGAAEAEAEAESVGPRKVRSTPPVRKYAKDRGVDLTQVTPAGEDGVIRRSDIDAHLAGAAASPSAQHAAAELAAPAGQGAATGQAAPAAAAPAAGTAYQRPQFDRSGEREERVDVKGVTKMMAQAMVASKFSAPHVTEFITVDVSATMELVERLKTDREFRDLKISPLLILAKAMTIAVRRNPGINAVWDEEAQQIVRRNYVNLGIAAATPRGLIVPNIKDADLMDLRQLAEALQDLVATAKSGRTQPADQSGGTYDGDVIRLGHFYPSKLLEVSRS